MKGKAKDKPPLPVAQNPLLFRGRPGKKGGMIYRTVKAIQAEMAETEVVALVIHAIVKGSDKET